MPSLFLKKYERASEMVAQWIAAEHRQARSAKILSYPQAWEMDLEVGSGHVAILLCLPEDFPLQDPVILVKNPEDFWGKVPHVERSGKLCLSSTNAVHGIEQAVPLVQGALCDARDLLENPSFRDFAEEFNSYWASDPRPPDAVLLCKDGLPEEPWCRKNNREIVLGDEKEVVDRWCANTGRPFDEAKRICRIDIGHEMLPIDFPSNLKTLHALLDDKDHALAAKLKNHVKTRSSYLVLPLRILVSGEKVDAAIGVQGTGDSPPRNGFRSQSEVPWGLIERDSPLIQRILLRSVTTQTVVKRSGDGFDLSNKRVVLVGCGSLGGYLAQMLARASVGRLTLIDAEALGWENAGRHVLGGAYIGRNKAEALKTAFGIENPQVEVKALAKKAEVVMRDHPQVLKEADILISATGDWPLEYKLNYWRTYTHGAPPLLFTWLESFAVAGHSFYISPTKGACLNCYFSTSGHFAKAVVDPREVEPQKEPSCAGIYQPYGPIDMVPTAAMAAAHAVDVLLGRESSSDLRTWLGARTRFELHSVAPMNGWSERLSAMPFGSVHEQAMPPAETCPLCS